LAIDAALQSIQDANVTPAIHFYYWGDDLSPACLDYGCNGKSRAAWDQLARQLTEHLWADLGGKPALILVETEFNKGSVAHDASFDAALAATETNLRQLYPAAQLVLAFGDWNLDAWSNWNKAAAASDAVGLQAITAWPRHTLAQQAALYNLTLTGVSRLAQLFHKPVVLTDVALSSYGPSGESIQETSMRRFFAGLPDLRKAGTTTVLYRSLVDASNATDYFGVAEAHFGLGFSATSLKPAGLAWLDGVAAERARPVL